MVSNAHVRQLTERSERVRYRVEHERRNSISTNLVFSLSNMAAAGEKTLTQAHSRNHVTDLSTEGGNLFKMAAKTKSERIWVRGLEAGEQQTKWRQRQTRKKLEIF